MNKIAYIFFILWLTLAQSVQEKPDKMIHVELNTLLKFDVTQQNTLLLKIDNIPIGQDIYIQTQNIDWEYEQFEIKLNEIPVKGNEPSRTSNTGSELFKLLYKEKIQYVCHADQNCSLTLQYKNRQAKSVFISFVQNYKILGSESTFGPIKVENVEDLNFFRNMYYEIEENECEFLFKIEKKGQFLGTFELYQHEKETENDISLTVSKSKFGSKEQNCQYIQGRAPIFICTDSAYISLKMERLKKTEEVKGSFYFSLFDVKSQLLKSEIITKKTNAFANQVIQLYYIEPEKINDMEIQFLLNNEPTDQFRYDVLCGKGFRKSSFGSDQIAAFFTPKEEYYVVLYTEVRNKNIFYTMKQFVNKAIKIDDSEEKKVQLNYKKKQQFLYYYGKNPENLDISIGNLYQTVTPFSNFNGFYNIYLNPDESDIQFPSFENYQVSSNFGSLKEGKEQKIVWGIDNMKQTGNLFILFNIELLIEEKDKESRKALGFQVQQGKPISSNQISQGIPEKFFIQPKKSLKVTGLIQNKSKSIVIEGQNMRHLEVQCNFSEKKVTVDQSSDRSDTAHIFTIKAEDIQKKCPGSDPCSIDFTIHNPQEKDRNFRFSYRILEQNEEKDISGPLPVPSLVQDQSTNFGYYNKKTVFLYEVEVEKTGKLLSLYSYPSYFEKFKCQMSIAQDSKEFVYEFSEKQEKYGKYGLFCPENQEKCTIFLSILLDCEYNAGSLYVSFQDLTSLPVFDPEIPVQKLNEDFESNFVQQIFQISPKKLDEKWNLQANFNQFAQYNVLLKEQNTVKELAEYKNVDDEAGFEDLEGSLLVFVYMKPEQKGEFQFLSFSEPVFHEFSEKSTIFKPNLDPFLFSYYEIKEKNSDYVMIKMNKYWEQRPNSMKMWAISTENQINIAYPSGPSYLGKDVLTGNGDNIYWVIKKTEYPDIFAGENSRVLFKFYLDPKICDNHLCDMEMNLEEGKQQAIKEIKPIASQFTAIKFDPISLKIKTTFSFDTTQQQQQGKEVSHILVNVQNPMLLQGIIYEILCEGKKFSGSVEYKNRGSYSFFDLELKEKKIYEIQIVFSAEGKEINYDNYHFVQFLPFSMAEKEDKVPVFGVISMKSQNSKLKGVSQYLRTIGQEKVIKDNKYKYEAKFCFLGKFAKSQQISDFVVSAQKQVAIFEDFDIEIQVAQIKESQVGNVGLWPKKKNSNKVKNANSLFVGGDSLEGEDGYLAISVYVEYLRDPLSSHNDVFLVSLGKLGDISIKEDIGVQVNKLLVSCSFWQKSNDLNTMSLLKEYSAQGSDWGLNYKVFSIGKDGKQQFLEEISVSKSNDLKNVFEQFMYLMQEKTNTNFFLTVYPQVYPDYFGYYLSQNTFSKGKDIFNLVRLENSQMKLEFSRFQQNQKLIYQDFEIQGDEERDIELRFMKDIDTDEKNIRIDYTLMDSEQDVLPNQFKNSVIYENLTDFSHYYKVLQIKLLKTGEKSTRLLIRITVMGKQQKGNLFIQVSQPMLEKEQLLKGQSLFLPLSNEFPIQEKIFKIKKDLLSSKGELFRIQSQSFMAQNDISLSIFIGNKEAKTKMYPAKGPVEIMNFSKKELNDDNSFCMGNVCEIKILAQVYKKIEKQGQNQAILVQLGYRNEKAIGPFAGQLGVTEKVMLWKGDKFNNNSNSNSNNNVQAFQYEFEELFSDQSIVSVCVDDFKGKNQVYVYWDEKQGGFPEVSEDKLEKIWGNQASSSSVAIFNPCEKTSCKQRFTLYVNNLKENDYDSSFFIKIVGKNDMDIIRYQYEKEMEPKLNQVFSYSMLGQQDQETTEISACEIEKGKKYGESSYYYGELTNFYLIQEGEYGMKVVQMIENIHNQESFVIENPVNRQRVLVVKDPSYASYIDYVFSPFSSEKEVKMGIQETLLIESGGSVYRKLKVGSGGLREIYLQSEFEQLNNVEVSFIGYREVPQNNVLYPTRMNIQYEVEDKGKKYIRIPLKEQDYSYLYFRIDNTDYKEKESRLLYVKFLKTLPSTGSEDYDLIYATVGIGMLALIVGGIVYYNCVYKKRTRRDQQDGDDYGRLEGEPDLIVNQEIHNQHRVSVE